MRTARLSAGAAAPEPPQPHFPSPYLRPHTAPVETRHIRMDDGAHIAAYVYGNRPCDVDATVRPPVLFLHGNGEEHGIFGPMIDAVAERGYAVVDFGHDRGFSSHSVLLYRYLWGHFRISDVSGRHAYPAYVRIMPI